MTDALGYIVYVCGGRSFFGAHPGRKIFEVVKCWRDLGFEVEHVCGGDVTAGVTNGGVQGADSPRPGKSRLRSLLPAAAHSVAEYRDIRHDKRILEHLRELSKIRQPQLIWERSARLHSAGQIHAREIGVPYVLEWKDHLIDYRWSLFRRLALKREDTKNRLADRIVVESRVLQADLVMAGVDEAKILVAHNAIDPAEFKPNAEARARKRAEVNANEDCVLAGYLGSFAFYHNTELLIAAASLVRNSNLKFVLIGDGLELQQTRALAQRTGVLDRNLFILPRVKTVEVPEVLCALDIAILPGSTDIICPIKVQEYMSSETATVAPDYACNREVISEPQLGALFEPGNAEALAAAIDNLADDATQRNAIARAGRKHVTNRFTWSATWGRVLRQIVSETVEQSGSLATQPSRTCYDD